MATIKASAQQPGVSIGTVFHVLGGRVTVSPEMRRRVEAAMAKMDFHPNHTAQMLKRPNQQLLGMVVSVITKPFFPAVVRGAEDAQPSTASCSRSSIPMTV